VTDIMDAIREWVNSMRKRPDVSDDDLIISLQLMLEDILVVEDAWEDDGT